MTPIQFIKTMLQLETLKIYGANIFVYLSTFTPIDPILKTILLAASIVYTGVKTWEIIKRNRKK